MNYNMNFKGVVYHYCSYDTFLKIIENKCIRASDPLKMNDLSELTEWIDLISDEDLREYILNVDSFKEYRNNLDKLREDYKNYLGEGQSQVYISCFCKDGNLLSQWIHYADNSKGVALGFDCQKLLQFQNVEIKEVQYIDHKNPADNCLPLINIRLISKYSDFSNYSHEEKKDFLFQCLLLDSARYKNKFFHEEKEVRLIYASNIKGLSEKTVLNQKLKISGKGKGYIDYPIKNSLTEIVIGRNCPKSESDIDQELKQNNINYKVKITKSKGPYVID